MKKLTFLVIAGLLFSLLISNLALSEMAEIKVGKGTLKIGGILQAGFSYFADDDMGNNSFFLNRARFLFWGTIVPDRVKYFVQLEHNKGVGVLDYKAQFFYIPQTEITFGRFLPNFTLYMPYSTAKLEMIGYPWTTASYAVWRQCGVQTTTKTDYVDFNLGIFNGGDIPNNFADNNDAKDFLLRADIKPPIEEGEVRFGGYAWLGFAPDPTDINNEETLKRNRYGGFAKVDYTKDEVTVRFRGEFLMAEDEYMAATKSAYDKETWDSQAFFAHVGVQPGKRMEFLFRYDSFDPCTDMDDDRLSAFTFGINHYIDGINSMFYLNYIYNTAQGDDPEFDILLAQAQITF